MRACVAVGVSVSCRCGPTPGIGKGHVPSEHLLHHRIGLGVLHPLGTAGTKASLSRCDVACVCLRVGGVGGACMGHDIHPPNKPCQPPTLAHTHTHITLSHLHLPQPTHTHTHTHAHLRIRGLPGAAGQTPSSTCVYVCVRVRVCRRGSGRGYHAQCDCGKGPSCGVPCKY